MGFAKNIIRTMSSFAIAVATLTVVNALFKKSRKMKLEKSTTT
jgi:hypothetical protein